MAFRFACICISAVWAGFPDPADATDFAQGEQRDAWLRHPVLGDPSFDAFERLPGNPVVRGAAPYDWPVNGSLFRDPVSGDCFLYVGHYCEGYKIMPEAPSMCTVSRSKDGGKTWERIGPIFEPYEHLFEGETSPMRSAPDCVVIYADGRYHMCFDWCTDNTTWENAANPPANANSGAAYAWAEKPEGPFHIAARPIATTRNQSLLEGKYRRIYASSLIKRANDWLVLTLTDSGPHFGWALLGMTAPSPEGPYASAKMLLHPESESFYPALLEFFPAFAHEGFVYAPATSVALNRNFQTVFRVQIEQAMEPGAWEIYQHGSVWHAELVEHEAFGIWGQTFNGFVDPEGQFRVMFPSRDSQGRGTINIASRPWNTPYRERGFVFSGHEGPSITFLKQRGTIKRLSATLRHSGEITLLWNAQGPLGPDRPASNSSLHALCATSYCGLRLRDDGWALVDVDSGGQAVERANGPLAKADNRACDIVWNGDGAAKLAIGGTEAWSGALPAGPGNVGLLAGKHSHAAVERFEVDGLSEPARFVYLYTDGLVGAAQNMADWENVRDDAFRYGIGVVSKGPNVRVKWNTEARAITVWAPKGPAYGKGEALLDGKPVEVIDFSAPEATKSAPVYTWEGETPGRHAFVVRGMDGRLPIDSVEAMP